MAGVGTAVVRDEGSGSLLCVVRAVCAAEARFCFMDPEPGTLIVLWTLPALQYDMIPLLLFCYGTGATYCNPFTPRTDDLYDVFLLQFMIEICQAG